MDFLVLSFRSVVSQRAFIIKITLFEKYITLLVFLQNFENILLVILLVQVLPTALEGQIMVDVRVSLLLAPYFLFMYEYY